MCSHHIVHDATCLSARCLSSFCLLPVSLPLLPCLFHSLPVLRPAHHLQCRHFQVKTTALTHNEEYCPVATYNPLTGYEPKLLDNFDYSETSAMIFQDASGDIGTEPSCWCDAELDDEIIGRTLPSPLFVQEREEPANLRQVYHSHEVIFRTHKYGETRIRT